MFGPHSEGSVVVGGLILHVLKERQPQLSHQPFCYALMLLACVHYLYKDRQVHCNSSGFHSQRFQWATVFSSPEVEKVQSSLSIHSQAYFRLTINRPC